MVGYARFDTFEQLELVQRIYRLLALYQNYFAPSRKVVAKKRVAAKLIKTYDTAQTPAQQLLSRKHIPSDTKRAMKQTFRDLNPAQLLRTINDLMHELYQTLSG